MRWRVIAVATVVVVVVATAFWRYGATSRIPVPRVPIRPHTTGKLAFLAGSGIGVFGSLDVYVANRDGNRPMRLTSRTSHYTTVAWSPDGSQLAYAESFGEFGGGRIWLVDPATEHARVLLRISGSGGSGLTWSPDGRWLGYYASTGSGDDGSVQYSLFAVPSEGGKAVQLTEGPLDAFDPAWSPDGTHIAFDGEFIGQGNPGSDLYVMNADGSDIRDLTSTTGLAERDPAWSPDGNWISFESGQSGQRVDLIRPDGSGRKTIYDCQCNGLVSGPTWAPDGSMLAIAKQSGIVLMRPDGSDVHPLRVDVPSPTVTVCCAAWQPRSG